LIFETEISLAASVVYETWVSHTLAIDKRAPHTHTKVG